MRERREDHGSVRERTDRSQRVRRVDHDPQRAPDGPGRHREMFGHEVDGEFLPPVSQPSLVAHVTIVTPHPPEVRALIAEALAVDALKEVVELEVVEDDQSRLALAEEPGVREEHRVVAEVVNGQIQPVQPGKQRGRDVAQRCGVGGVDGGFVEAVGGFREEVGVERLAEFGGEAMS